MLSKSLTEIKKHHKLLILLLILIFFLVRVPGLGRDAINPDAVNWHGRSQQFVVGLKFLDLQKTYQHYHPGVTLMWITGIPIEVYKQAAGIQYYNVKNFMEFHRVALYSLLVVHLLLLAAVFFLLYKIFGFDPAFFTVLFLILDPFFLGNSRLYHMDVLFILLVFLSLLFFYLALKSGKILELFITGVFTGLAVLTRTIGIGLIPFYFLIITITSLSKSLFIKDMKKFMIILFVFLGTVFLFFPALWVSPIETVMNIFMESERVGIRKGHSQIFYGVLNNDPGFMFYPVVILIKSTPFLLTGVLLLKIRWLLGFFHSFKKSKILKKIKGIRENFLIMGSVFYTGYFIAMSFPTKKIDRYMLLLWPFLFLLAYYGYKYLFDLIKEMRQGRSMFISIFLFLSFIFVVLPLAKIFPYYFTYTNPAFGSPIEANSFIGQKSFGVGISEVKDLVVERYANEVFAEKYRRIKENIPDPDDNLPEIGMIDTKPIKSIYPNSRVSDIRINGTGDYDVLILAINEKFPDKVRESSERYQLEEIIEINGLPYWRIYVKEK